MCEYVRRSEITVWPVVVASSSSQAFGSFGVVPLGDDGGVVAFGEAGGKEEGGEGGGGYGRFHRLDRREFISKLMGEFAVTPALQNDGRQNEAIDSTRPLRRRDRDPSKKDRRGAEAPAAALEKYDDKDEDEDEDDDEDLMQRRALAVVGDPDWSTEGPPATAEEYLRRVRWEARRCPNVVRADEPTRATLGAKNTRTPSARSIARSSMLPTIVRLPPAPPHAAPTAPWQHALVTSFSELRMRLANVLSARRSTNARAQTKQSLPNMNDPEAWRRFCLGTSVGEDGIASDGPSARNPSVDILVQLGEANVALLLRHAVTWLEADAEGASETCDDNAMCTSLLPPSYDHSMWLFALCAAVSKPLDADTCASLRSMLRHCCILRAACDQASSDRIARINTLIVIAGRYFRQRSDDDDE